MTENLPTRMRPPQSDISHTTQSNDVPPLQFPELPNQLPLLLELGASEDYAHLLYDRFINAAQNVEATLTQHYYADAPKLCTMFAMDHRSTYVQATQNHLILLRTQTIERMWNALFSRAQTLLNKVCLTQDNNSPSDTASPSIICTRPSKRKRQGRPPPFTAEQTFALNALFARDEQYSPADKEFIALNLNLTRDQVNRWFCNARARSKSSTRSPLRCGSPDSIGTVSTSTEFHQTDQGADVSVATNPASGLNDPSTGFTNPTFQVDSLDVYLSHSACWEPEQRHSDLTGDNLPTLQDEGSFITQITSWSKSASANHRALSSSSPVGPQAATTRAPIATPLCSEPQEWSGDLTSLNEAFDPLNFNFNFNFTSPQPSIASSALETIPGNELFPSFDISQW